MTPHYTTPTTVPSTQSKGKGRLEKRKRTYIRRANEKKHKKDFSAAYSTPKTRNRILNTHKSTVKKIRKRGDD